MLLKDTTTEYGRKETSSEPASYKFTYDKEESATLYLLSSASAIRIFAIKIVMTTYEEGSDGGATEPGGTGGESGDAGGEQGGEQGGDAGGDATLEIRSSDLPQGFASTGIGSAFGGAGGTSVTVTTKAQLLSAISGTTKKVIYIDGMIDMSDGMLPTIGGGSTTALDNFVKTKTGGAFTTYSSFITAYAAGCSKSTEDGDRANPKSEYGAMLWTLNQAYTDVIKLSLTNANSNKTIIGLTNKSGLKGVTISINSAKNIAIRNLIIQDAYDPFPHHESNDGFNAQHDGIVIQGTASGIWVDHCTFKDTMTLVNAANGEKWQTYDGLLDMKGDIKNITVSYCRFENHDKTMLIGSSDSDGSNATRTITLHHNYFYNCAQRLPLARNTRLHIFNNYFDTDSTKVYSNSYAINVRKGSLIISENNYFGTGIGYSHKDSYGTLYMAGNVDNSAKKHNSSVSGTKPFSTTYTYTVEDATDAKASVLASSGAGVCSVIK